LILLPKHLANALILLPKQERTAPMSIVNCISSEKADFAIDRDNQALLFASFIFGVKRKAKVRETRRGQGASTG
jgi:hypothetical protein